MSTEGIIAGAVTGVVLGVVSTVITHRTLCNIDSETHKAELHDARQDGVNEGWRSALNHPGQIRQAYEKLFGTPDTEAGTTTKARKS